MRSRGPIVVLALAVAAVVFLAITPAFLLRPFVPQTPHGVALAYHLRAVSPWVAPPAALVAFAAGATIAWRARSWLVRAACGLAVVVACLAAVFARWNMFEGMFPPVGSPRFVAAGEIPQLADTDMVLGVALGGEARAYPVRVMAHHHVLNDVVAGEPIVATY